MEGAMNTTNQNNIGKGARPVTSRLHPFVYVLLVALALWLVLSVWSFFAGGGVTDYLLFIVSGFIFIAVALPFILSRVGRTDDATNGRTAKSGDQPPSFRDWAASDFDIWQGRLSGTQAALQILLPIAAVAFGMTAFGIALHIAEHGGA
jgi:hypothetical protein